MDPIILNPVHSLEMFASCASPWSLPRSLFYCKVSPSGATSSYIKKIMPMYHFDSDNKYFQFDGSLADLLKSGSKEEPRLYFRLKKFFVELMLSLN